MADPRGSAAELWGRFRGAPNSTRIAILVGAATFVSLLAYAASQTASPSMGVLFSNLSQDDAARITDRLRTMGVSYETVEEGGTVLVPESRVHDVRLTLASEGLPLGGGVGFEVFDQQRFGESEFSEQVKYHRALEGELARTISHLGGVRRARVHLVLPKRALFTSSEQKASASVVLHLRPGFKMSDGQAQGITHLVAASVRGLEIERVTMVDGQGEPLGKPNKGVEQNVTDSLAFRRQVEQTRETAVQQLLDRTLGPGKAIVRVAADVNFSREERTEERFDPEAIAPRSFQLEEEANGSEGRIAAGIPGTPSNLPGGEAPQSARTNDKLTRRRETRNFEVSKVTRRAVEPVGRIEGLQVAVVVDGEWSGEGAERTFQPRPQEELDRIEAIVSSAVGLDAERGDAITVECIPFAPEVEPVDNRLPLEVYADKYAPYIEWATKGRGGLVGLILLVIAMRKIKRRVEPVTVVGELEEGHTPPALGSSELRAQAESAAATANEQDEQAEEIRLLAADIAKAQPETTARVVRGWLMEDAP